MKVLFEVVEEAIGVSHDGWQYPKWGGKPGYNSEGDGPVELTSHCGRTRLMKAEYVHEAFAQHRKNLSTSPKWGPAGSRLDCGCIDLGK
jgi:hypothetical protein